MMSQPTVTIAVPVLDEEPFIGACLDAIGAQTYPHIVEVLVIDGGSNDQTREVAERPGVTVLDNPHGIQAAALNVALDVAKGDVFVRVDGHCLIEPDYVERCVDALHRTGAAMVGGAMRPVAQGWKQRGIAAAMSSPFGVGPARFHVGGKPGWVDTVYLGAYRTKAARGVGGYAAVATNEDAEFAIRIGQSGGVWFDPTIRSTYTPRSSFFTLARQFYRYGRGRAATVRRHPGSLAPRQVAAPLLLVALLTPWRRPVAAAYAAVVVGAATRESPWDATKLAAFTASLPIIHLSWGMGFVIGLIVPSEPRTSIGREEVLDDPAQLNAQELVECQRRVP